MTAERESKTGSTHNKEPDPRAKSADGEEVFKPHTQKNLTTRKGENRKMARLAGVDLPRNKRMIIALTYIYGIGPTRSAKILAATGISPDLRTDDLTEEDIKNLRNELANYHIEGDLRREVTMHIKRLQEIGSYRGLRHKRKLPVRGQRTKTNARTRRGKKNGAVAKKK